MPVNVTISAQALVDLDTALLNAQQAAHALDPTLQTSFATPLTLKPAPPVGGDNGVATFDSIEALRTKIRSMLTPSEAVGFTAVNR